MIVSPGTENSRLTTVMYHYVRPLAASTFPRLKALELDDFLGQLDHLHANYNILSIDVFSAVLNGRVPLPERACLLTFDDGYSDHYRYVFPHLVKRGLGALFFAPKSSLIDRQLLDVNRIQFTLASHRQPEMLADEIDAILAAEGIDTANLRATHFSPNRYDGPEVAYAKRLLQHALPSDLRSRVAADLFAAHVSADEAGFADELYLSGEQAREMRGFGMEFGGHGDHHFWHGLASEDELAREISGAECALRAIGAPVEGGYYCYPFGSENARVRKAISDAGFQAGFTVEPDLWAPEADRRGISRLDTNDLPHRLQDHSAVRSVQKL